MNANDSSVLEMRESSTNPGELEVVFNTIADSTLSYTLEGSDTLHSNDWEPLKTIIGADGEPVVTAESEWPDHTHYFFRLRVSS